MKDLNQIIEKLTQKLQSSFPLAYSVAQRNPVKVSLCQNMGVDAGTCDMNGNIEINADLIARHPEALEEVVAHEFAHHVANQMYHDLKGHGAEWERVMKALGYAPKANHNYDLSDLRTNDQQVFQYKCFCTTHKVSKEKHQHIQSHGANCSYCDNPVKLVA